MSSSRKKSDDLVPCLKCEKLLTRSNLQRHVRRHCPVALGRYVPGSVEPSTRDVSESPSRGRSRQTRSGAQRREVGSEGSDSPWPSTAGCRAPRSGQRGGSVSSTSSAATCEEKVSSATIEKATLAILDRHDEYSKDALCAFLARCYPNIPAVCRKVLVVAAATGARRAAQLHGLVARDSRSANVALRKLPIGAADILDCWSLGLDPPHRAGRTFERHQRINAEARDDPMSRAMTEAGLDAIVSRYDVCDLTQRMQTNEDELANASRARKVCRELMDADQRNRESYLLRIGSAVLGHLPPTVVSREEQHVPTGGSSSAEVIVTLTTTLTLHERRDERRETRDDRRPTRSL